MYLPIFSYTFPHRHVYCNVPSHPPTPSCNFISPIVSSYDSRCPFVALCLPVPSCVFLYFSMPASTLLCPSMSSDSSICTPMSFRVLECPPTPPPMSSGDGLCPLYFTVFPSISLCLLALSCIFSKTLVHLSMHPCIVGCLLVFSGVFLCRPMPHHASLCPPVFPCISLCPRRPLGVFTFFWSPCVILLHMLFLSILPSYRWPELYARPGGFSNSARTHNAQTRIGWSYAHRCVGSPLIARNPGDHQSFYDEPIYLCHREGGTEGNCHDERCLRRSGGTLAYLAMKHSFTQSRHVGQFGADRGYGHG